MFFDIYPLSKWLVESSVTIELIHTIKPGSGVSFLDDNTWTSQDIEFAGNSSHLSKRGDVGMTLKINYI